jgi:putative glutamine amidotransferase
MGTRPIIGLTTYAEEARFGLQDTFAAVLPLSYVHAVHSSGGRAVLVTPDDPDPDVLAGLDGIMFTGGSDVDPALYGESPHPTTHVKPERDTAEMMLMRAAVAEGLSSASAGACS